MVLSETKLLQSIVLNLHTAPYHNVIHDIIWKRYLQEVLCGVENKRTESSKLPIVSAPCDVNLSSQKVRYLVLKY